MMQTIKVGDKFETHSKLKFENGYHEFDSDCEVTSVYDDRVEYTVVRQFNEVNRPLWQTSDVTKTGGGFSRRHCEIRDGKLVTKKR